MITANLIGGLGVQMSQIATTYTVALDNNDICAFKLYKRLYYGSFTHSPAAYRTNVYSKIKNLPLSWKSEFLYVDINNEFVPIPYHKNMMLGGFLCWPEYFNHRRKEIIDLFKNKTIFSILKKANFKNSVSLHVRRGDYILNKKSLLLTKEYYKRALAYIENKAQIDIIYVFVENKFEQTQDLLWCKNNLKDSRIVFKEGNRDYIDMYIMSLCTHNIIANSMFSWWGSYLNENENKIVCAPAEWFLSVKPPTPKPFACDNWILIEN